MPGRLASWIVIGLATLAAPGGAGADGHDDPAQALRVTRRLFYDRRGAAAGHHFVGFRCAIDRHGGPRHGPQTPKRSERPGKPGALLERLWEVGAWARR